MADAYPPETLPAARPAPAPWWLIGRGPAIASDPRSIILAALGLAAIRAGWAGLSLAMGPMPWLDAKPGYLPGLDGWATPDSLIRAALAPVLGLIAPFVALFRPDVPGWGRLEAGLACLWLLLVWGLFGTAIARIAVVRSASEGRVGLIEALAFSLRRIGSTLAAPLAPILVAALIAVPAALVGLLDRIPGTIGTSAAAVLAFVPLVAGLLDAVILLGLALAWPLMIATVAAEGEDFFDAISRSYSYVNQRTARYAVYLLASLVVAAIGLAVASAFVVAALGLADWCTGLAAPGHEGFRFLDPSSPARSGLPAVGHFWRGAVEMLAAGWIYSEFWSGLAIIYLLLRLDVDGADVHDLAAADEPK